MTYSVSFPQNSTFILLGKLSYYTKDGMVVPCIILSESIIPKEITIIEGHGICDTDGKVFENSKRFVNGWGIPELVSSPIPEPEGEKKVLGGIEVFDSTQFEVPKEFTKTYIQELKEKRERRNKNNKRDGVIIGIIVTIVFIGLAIFSIVKCSNM